MPERFSLSYIDEQGREARPVMIHCALLGSIERFLAVYIEHTSGKFPVWLAPEQIRIATLNDNDKVIGLAKEVLVQALGKGLRTELDDSNESVSKKILESEKMKVPYTLVIGGKEVENHKVTPRTRQDLKPLPELSIEEFLTKVVQESSSRS
jgi:threonyl-tRNA synthetase